MTRLPDFEFNVLIIEPDFNLASMYWSIIDRINQFKVVAVYGTVGEALKKIPRDEPNIALVSFDPDDSESIEWLSRFESRASRMEIIAMVDEVKSDWIMQAIGYGISGIIKKSNKLTEIEKALYFAANQECYLSPEVVKKFIAVNKKNISSPLSNREVEVLRLMTLGKTYSMMAKDLNISKETSRSHMKNIYTKLSVSSKAEAIFKAREQNII